MLGTYEPDSYILFPKNIDLIKISISSPEIIKENSSGEISDPGLLEITEHGIKPVTKGLFCENIFGNLNEYTCDCGIMGFTDEKTLTGGYPKIKSDPSRFEAHIGNKCRICRQEITPIGLRLKRWGHINLTAPVTHIWFLDSMPSYFSVLLDIPPRDLKIIIYYDKYIVTESEVPELAFKKLLSENQYREAIEEFGEDKFKAEIGAKAVDVLLQKIDLDKLYYETKNTIKKDVSTKKNSRLSNKLKILEAFLSFKGSLTDLVLKTIPVLPPDLRFVIYNNKTKEIRYNPINLFYQDVINKNNRVSRLITLNAPDIIIRCEKRELQEAVDRLLYHRMHYKMCEGSDWEKLDLSMSELLTYVIDDQPRCRLGACQQPDSFKKVNVPTGQNLIKDVLYVAKRIKDHGQKNTLNNNNNDSNALQNIIFISLLNKLRGLCLNVEYIDKSNNVSEEDLNITYFADEDKYDLCYSEIKKAMGKNPNDADAYWARGELYLERKLFDSAALDFTKVIELNPTRAEAYYKRGLSYVGPEGNSPEARLLRAIFGEKEDQNDWETSACIERYYDGATSDFTKAIEIKPDYTQAYYERAKIYEQQHKYDEALADLIKLIEIDPNHLEACKKIGEISGQENYEKRGLAAFTKIMNSEPNNFKAYKKCGDIYLKNKEYEHAIQIYEKYIELNQKNMTVVDELAKVYVQKGNYAKAIEMFEEFLRSDPDNDAIYIKIANVYEQEGENEKAVEKYKELIRSQPTEPDYYCLLAEFYDSKGEHGSAVEYLGKAIELDPANDEYYEMRADIYSKMEQYDQALMDINKLIKLLSSEDVDIGIIYFNRGSLYLKTGEYNKAIQDFNRSLGGFSDGKGLKFIKEETGYYLEVLLNKAKALEIIDLKEQALEIYNNIINEIESDEKLIIENAEEITFAKKKIIELN